MAEVTLKRLTPSAGIVRAARQTRRSLESSRAADRPHLVLAAGPVQAEVRVPQELAELVQAALVELSRGHTVRLVREDEELTTQQAAKLLNVSRPFLTKLLTRGEIPHHRVGAHRRVYRTDVEAYHRAQAARAQQALREMTAEAEDLGLYD